MRNYQIETTVLDTPAMFIITDYCFMSSVFIDQNLKLGHFKTLSMIFNRYDSI
jgi:hypothetical protein